AVHSSLALHGWLSDARTALLARPAADSHSDGGDFNHIYHSSDRLPRSTCRTVFNGDPWRRGSGRRPCLHWTGRTMARARRSSTEETILMVTTCINLDETK